MNNTIYVCIFISKHTPHTQIEINFTSFFVTSIHDVFFHVCVCVDEMKTLFSQRTKGTQKNYFKNAHNFFYCSQPSQQLNNFIATKKKEQSNYATTAQEENTKVKYTKKQNSKLQLQLNKIKRM